MNLNGVSKSIHTKLSASQAMQTTHSLLQRDCPVEIENYKVDI